MRQQKIARGSQENDEEAQTAEASFGPSCTQKLRLSEHGPAGLSLKVRRVTKPVQDAFDDHPNSRSHPLAQGPVNGDALSHLGDQFGGDHLELVVAHGLHGTVVGRQRVVEGHFLIVQIQLYTALVGRAQVSAGDWEGPQAGGDAAEGVGGAG